MIDLYKDLGFLLSLEKPGLFSTIPTAQQSNFENGVAVKVIGSGESINEVSMVKGHLQSDGFKTGVVGWRIDSKGNVEFGSGYFRGDITGSNGTFSGTMSVANLTAGTISSKDIVLAITAGTGDSAIRAGKTDFTNTETGFILGLDDSDSDKPKFYIGSSTKYLNWDGTSLTIRGTLNADDITAGTLIGRTLKATNGSGQDIWIDSSDGQIKFRYGGATKAYSYADSSGNLVIDSDNNVSIQANNYIFNTYNDDGGGDGCGWINDTTGAMTLDDDNDLTVADNVYADNYYDYAEFFESTDEYLDGIQVGTTVVLVGEKVRPALAGEIPFGAVSGSAAIILNAGSTDAGKSWGRKYLTDEFGQKIFEEKERWYLIGDEKRKAKLKNKITKGWCDEHNPPKTSVIKIKKRQIINPDYDETREFIPRKKRSEWNKVGLVGRVRIKKGQPVSHNWIKLQDISDKVEEWLVR